jgi:uncharacterized membrane protein YbhN (UPF0104 family)
MHAKANLKKYIQKYWLFLFFIILFVLIALFKISLKEILGTVSHLKVWQLLALLFLYGLISTSVILSRKYLLYALSTTATTRNLIYIHFSSMAAHYSTPAKLGFPLTVYLLKKFEDVPYGTGTAMILIELMVSTGICGFLALIGSFFYFTLDSRVLTCLLLSLFVLLVLAYFATHRMMRKAKENSRIYQFTKSVIEAFSRISWGKLICYGLIMTFIQVLGSLNLVLLSHFFFANLSLFQSIVANSTAFFLGAISMVPMGIGVREASMLFYLHHMGLNNEVGLSIVTIQRLLSTGLSFVLGTIFGSGLGLKNASQTTNSAND